jgi:adenylosuccinate lyase
MPLSSLSALSPLDGRYAVKVDALRTTLSEAGFMHHRVKVEVSWLQALAEAGFDEIKPFSDDAKALLNKLVVEFSEADAQRIKDIEAVTNHDVKAVEYWLKEKVADRQNWLLRVNSYTLPALRRHQQYVARHDAENRA